jgi:hypothetical protein
LHGRKGQARANQYRLLRSVMVVQKLKRRPNGPASQLEIVLFC